MLSKLHVNIDVVAGSVTDSQMGEDYVRDTLGFEAGNARRAGAKLFGLVVASMKAEAIK